MLFTGGKKSFNMEERHRNRGASRIFGNLRRETEERGMDGKKLTGEDRLNEACIQGVELDGLLKQMSRGCDLTVGEDADLRRQEAFVRALLESEERKAQAREAMALEQERVRAMIAQLENMEP